MKIKNKAIKKQINNNILIKNNKTNKKIKKYRKNKA